MLLSIVVSKFGSIVESPLSRFAEIETIFADPYVAMVIVARSEIKPISKSGDRGLLEATVDRNGQFRPVFKVVNFSIFITSPHHCSRILITFRVLKIERDQKVAIGKIEFLGATSAFIFEFGLFR